MPHRQPIRRFILVWVACVVTCAVQSRPQAGRERLRATTTSPTRQASERVTNDGDQRKSEPEQRTTETSGSEQPTFVGRPTTEAQRRTSEPQRQTTEPQRQTTGPQRRSTGLQGRSIEPQRRTTEPQRRTMETQRRTIRPKRRTTEPQRQTTGPQRQTTEPERPTTAQEETTTGTERPTEPKPLTTFPPQTTVPRIGCRENGIWYPPGSDMSKGQNGKWCYGTYCSLDSEIIAWDDWSCGTTTRPTTEPTTEPRRRTTEPRRRTTEPERRTTEPEQTTTGTKRPITGLERQTIEPKRPTIEPKRPTTEPERPTNDPKRPKTKPERPTTKWKRRTTELIRTTPILTGCFYEGKWHPPGKISSGFDGSSWCYGVICEPTGGVLHWDDFRCGTTTESPPTTVPTKPTTLRGQTTFPSRPTTFRRQSTTLRRRPTSFRQTTMPSRSPTFRRQSTRPSRPTTFRRRPTTFRRRTTIPPRQGCYENSIRYSPGAQISKGRSGDTCYRTYCSYNGAKIMRENFTCSDVSTTRAINPTSSFRRETTVSPRAGCFENGKWYPPGAEISTDQIGDWCYGTYCSDDGQLLTWDSQNCETKSELTTESWTTAPVTTPPRHGCYYLGTWHPPGEISKGFDGRDWCYGVICEKGGAIQHWDNFDCGTRQTTIPFSTTTTAEPTNTPIKTSTKAAAMTPINTKTPQSTTPFSTSTNAASTTSIDTVTTQTTTVPRVMTEPITFQTTAPGCFHEGKWYQVGEISRGSDGKNWCYGVVCQRPGKVLVWDDFKCGVSTVPPPDTNLRVPEITTRKPRNTRVSEITARQPRTTRAVETITSQPPRTTRAAETTTSQKTRTTRAAETTALRQPTTIRAAETTTSRRPKTTRVPETTAQIPKTTRGAETTTSWQPKTTRVPETTARIPKTTRGAETATLQKPRTTRIPEKTTASQQPRTTRTRETITTLRPTTSRTRGEASTTPVPTTYRTRQTTTKRSALKSKSTTVEPKATSEHQPTYSVGCYHEGRWYAPGKDIYRSSDGHRWCFGARCSYDGNVIMWDDFHCQHHLTRLALKIHRNRKSQRRDCYYRGRKYKTGSRISYKSFSGRCYKGVCAGGRIKNWRSAVCPMKGNELRRSEIGRISPTPSVCRYKGRVYREGEKVISKSVHMSRGFGWCVGAKCGRNGRLVTWGPEWGSC